MTRPQQWPHIEGMISLSRTRRCVNPYTTRSSTSTLSFHFYFKIWTVSYLRAILKKEVGIGLSSDGCRKSRNHQGTAIMTSSACRTPHSAKMAKFEDSHEDRVEPPFPPQNSRLQIMPCLFCGLFVTARAWIQMLQSR